MNDSIYAQRRARALARIMESARMLVTTLHLDPALTDGLTPPARFDSAIQALLQLETLAMILEAVVNAGAVSTQPLEYTTETQDQVAKRLKGKRES